jgi:hypothetical protein
MKLGTFLGLFICKSFFFVTNKGYFSLSPVTLIFKTKKPNNATKRSRTLSFFHHDVLFSSTRSQTAAARSYLRLLRLFLRFLARFAAHLALFCFSALFRFSALFLVLLCFCFALDLMDIWISVYACIDVFM